MSEFIPANSFDALADKGQRIDIPAWGTWFPVFARVEDAQAFARYVGGFVRRTVQGSRTRASSPWSEMRKGFLPVLEIQFPWGCETGPVMCVDNWVRGIGLREGKKESVLLPIGPHRYSFRTKSGSLYVGFMDGTAYCRSVSEGPQQLAKELYFARSSKDAQLVLEQGGELQIVTNPGPGVFPLYVTGDEPTLGTQGGVVFEKGSFRLGTAVQSVVPAF